jgi:glycosyltransferase involved in cell wall biosynthesis
VATLGLTERVLWTGFTESEQVSANLTATDICVLPYRDGASFRRGSFMAALAHGLPIVSARPRVPLPALIDGQNILLVPSEDLAATATAVEHLIDAPEQRTHLGCGAFELAKLFAWDAIARQTDSLYAQLCQTR